MTAAVCAAEGCENPAARRAGRVGRPPIYCSPACRRSRRTANVVTVEVEHDADGDKGRDWLVRIHRGNKEIVVNWTLGYFTATSLATRIHSVIGADLVIPDLPSRSPTRQVGRKGDLTIE